MSTDRSFLKIISKLKRRFIVRTIGRSAIVASVVLLFGHTVAVGLEKSGVPILQRSMRFYAVSVCISLAAALLYATFKQKGFGRFLIDIDTRLNLKDTVSTAYEYVKLGKVSEFKDQLLEDASFKLSQLGRKQLFPLKYSFVHILLFILILTNGILLSIERFSFASKQTDRVSENSLNISHFRRDSPTPKNRLANRVKKTTKDQTYQKLETLAKRIADPSMTRKALLTALDEMLEEVQSTQSLLSKNTHSSPGSKNIKRLPYQDLQRYEESSLRRLKSLFRAMFTDKIPEKIEKDAALLAEYQRFKNVYGQDTGKN